MTYSPQHRIFLEIFHMPLCHWNMYYIIMPLLSIVSTPSLAVILLKVKWNYFGIFSQWCTDIHKDRREKWYIEVSVPQKNFWYFLILTLPLRYKSYTWKRSWRGFENLKYLLGNFWFIFDSNGIILFGIKYFACFKKQINSPIGETQLLQRTWSLWEGI